MPMAKASNTTTATEEQRHVETQTDEFYDVRDTLDAISEAVGALRALEELLYHMLWTQEGMARPNVDGLSKLFEAQFDIILKRSGSLREKWSVVWRAQKTNRDEFVQNKIVEAVATQLLNESIARDRDEKPAAADKEPAASEFPKDRKLVEAMMQEADTRTVCERYAIPQETLRDILYALVDTAQARQARPVDPVMPLDEYFHTEASSG